MATAIGAGAAKLAGLQIDLLQKIRRGQITVEQLEKFLLLPKSERVKLAVGDAVELSDSEVKARVLSQFYHVEYLGTLVVPDNFVGSRLSEPFGQRFPNPTTVARPGDMFVVSICAQKCSETSSLDRLAFLEAYKATLLGAQGIELVVNAFAPRLAKGHWFLSFDEQDELWIDEDREYRVPGVRCYAHGALELNLGHFNRGWGPDDFFLCFNQVRRY